MTPASYLEFVTSRAAVSRERSAMQAENRRIGRILHKTSTSSWDRDQLGALGVVVTARSCRILPYIAETEVANMIATGIKAHELRDENNLFWASVPMAREALAGLVNGRDRNIQCRTEYEYEKYHGESLGRVWAAVDRLEHGQWDDGGGGDGDIGVDTEEGYTQQQPRDDEVNQDCSRDFGSDLELDGSDPDSSQRLAATNHARTPRRARVPSTPPSLPLPTKRSRRSVNLPPGMVPFDESTRIDGSSPTAVRAALTSSSPGSNWTPREEARRDPNSPEDLTLDLMSSVLRHILRHVPSRPDYRYGGFGSAPVDFDPRKLFLCPDILGRVAFASIDDGGLWIRPLSRRDSHARVAVLETKRAMAAVVDGRPVFSDEWLAQIVGESLAARLTKNAWIGPASSVFVIVGARYFMRYLQIDITDGYLDSLERCVAADDETERAMGDDHVIPVACTPWFDLRNADNCVRVVQNISGIVQVAWIVAQGG
ncbi:hypothetical protein CSHISOI_09260 [Colletotrichum shisoi]|uniref:Uncharacterized protein n=1 Tax=Colletotrichum shisoi TaxID=2078593 RepID=A0A5Q4BH34_9PEZI|nr:hypothetical protein CSHISOI_09260 [Colletotrichum shisoi]